MYYEKTAKLPPEDLVEKTVFESKVGQEFGEFWALLDYVTKRFADVFVG